MIVTKYYCNDCKIEKPFQELHEVTISHSINYEYFRTSTKIHLCKNCYEKFYAKYLEKR